MLLTLLGGAGVTGPQPFTQSNYQAIVKEVESSVGIGLLLGATASGNSLVLGSVVSVAPTSAPTPDKPTIVILDDGSVQKLLIWMPTTAAWKEFVPV